MANIYDVNAAIDKPNLLGSALAGVRFGNDQRQLREQRADEAQLRALAPQIMAGDTGALEQAAVIDPARAGKFKAAGDAKWTALKGAVDYMDRAQASGKPEAVQAAWAGTVRPYMAKISGTNPPESFAEAAPHFANLRAKLAMIEGGQDQSELPTGYRELDLKARAAGYQPGTPEYQQAMQVGLGVRGRAASGGFGFEVLTGPDGKERIARKNPRTGVVEIYDETTGDFAPMGGGASLNGDSTAASAPGAYVDIDGLTAEQSDTLARGISALKASGASPEVQDAFAQSILSMPRTVGAPQGGRADLGVSQSPEQRKFAEESGQIAARQAAAPTQAALDAEAARQKALAEANAKAQAEREATATQRGVDAQRTLGLLDQAEGLIPLSTNSIGGNVIDQGAAALGYSTPGAQAIASLRTIAGQLTSAMPRMQGPQSDRDVQLYTQMAGDLANPNIPSETRMAALQTIRRLNQKYAGQQGGSRYHVGQVIQGGDGKRYRVTGGDLNNDPDVEEAR